MTLGGMLLGIGAVTLGAVGISAVAAIATSTIYTMVFQEQGINVYQAIAIGIGAGLVVLAWPIISRWAMSRFGLLGLELAGAGRIAVGRVGGSVIGGLGMGGSRAGLFRTIGLGLGRSFGGSWGIGAITGRLFTGAGTGVTQVGLWQRFITSTVNVGTGFLRGLGSLHAYLTGPTFSLNGLINGALTATQNFITSSSIYQGIVNGISAIENGINNWSDQAKAWCNSNLPDSVIKLLQNAKDFGRGAAWEWANGVTFRNVWHGEDAWVQKEGI